MFTTHELTKTVEKHERMMESLAEENGHLVSEWLSQAKQELTMRLIAGDDYATNRPDAESGER
ncbi:hypothetical protein SBP1_gp077 [Vibrio virus vB_VspP_SBP1]|uniref:Uncharacterized protein n=1 Tax=Vibrio virus vB_VspP_SBP1 TaxID=2500581 RepID=A0A3T0IIS7_9CAUD|nr:hypothetical protein KNU36_gp052 [Vibrio virus vB_VspP_SBP1]AZU99669.1 hypothetical protein SBP1_gp077 [Vibrio virus vB_VspP_SBP1]